MLTFVSLSLGFVLAARAEFVILCVGDSITEGVYVATPYPTRLASLMGQTVVNAGAGGERAYHGLARIDELLNIHRPAYVLILFGTNDILKPSADLKAAASSVILMAKRSRNAGAIPIIGTTPPMVTPRAFNTSRVNEFNTFLRSMASANGFLIADILKVFGSGLGLMLTDGFHPNNSGIQLIANTFATRISIPPPLLPAKPILLSPDFYSAETVRPTFQWQPASNASTYVITLLRDNQKVLSQVVGETFWMPNTNLPCGRYSWIVQGRNRRGDGTASDESFFYIMDARCRQDNLELMWPVGGYGQVNDFDGDGEYDFACFQRNTATWQISLHSGETNTRQFGWSEVKPVADDYDGDGITDVAVYFPAAGMWYIMSSGSGELRQINLGTIGSIPTPGDFDGDGMADPAVFNRTDAQWMIAGSLVGDISIQWGWFETTPVPADYDGDGITDVAIYNSSSGNWFIRESENGQLKMHQWGWREAMPTPGDYDGDGKADIAVYHRASSTWYIQSSTGAITIQQWGWPEVIPVPADFDNDGRVDIAVYDPQTGIWYIRASKDLRLTTKTWGGRDRQPVLLHPLIRADY